MTTNAHYGNVTSHIVEMVTRLENKMSTQRTSRGLTESLFEELDALKDGTSTPQNARAKAAIVNTICSITRLEMEHAKFITAARGENASTLAALPLGLVA